MTCTWLEGHASSLVQEVFIHNNWSKEYSLSLLCSSVQAYLLPKFKSWVRSILLEDSETDKKISPPTEGLPVEPPVNEAALAANAAASAASEVAAAMREFSHARAKGKSGTSRGLLDDFLLSCPLL